MTRKHDGELVEYRYDVVDIDNCGWYVARIGANGNVIEDSQKLWFPVDVDGYDDEDDLAAALREAFPGATVRAA